jgi:O-antigen ligase
MVTTAIAIAIGIVQQNVFALMAVAALGFATLFPVETSLGVFVILVPFDQVLVLGNSGVTLTWVAGAFAGVVLVLYGAASGRFKAPPPSGFYWGMFVLWTLASIVWAIDPAPSLKRFPTVMTLFAVYIVAASFRMTKQELSRIFTLVIVGGAVAASFIILQFANHIGFEGRASLVVGELESNPNTLAIGLLLPFSLALAGVFAEENLFKRTALLSGLALVATGIFLAMSRGALLALTATILVYLFRARPRKRVLIPILILAILLPFLPNLFYQRLKEAPAGRGTGRYDIWLVGLEIVKGYPVIGAGLANFPMAYQQLAGHALVFPHRGYIRDAHNMYLQVCGEMGVIGFGLFVAAICSQLRAVRYASNHGLRHFGVGIEAACWGQLAAGLSADIAWTKPFWLTFTLLSLIVQQTRKPQLNELGLA